MKDMFSIGELAGYQNISKQTLIFYDKIGLFQPAYVDPNNKYRYYTAQQIDYLDTILIMKELGFSLSEIQEHMKNYTIDTSLVILRKQLSVIDRQIKRLQLVQHRLAHRCEQMEHVKEFREGNQEVTVKDIPQSRILFAPVDAPQSFREISIATKKCFSQALKDELPIFFQTGVIVPYENILDGRCTEAAVAFLPIEKTKKAKNIKILPAGKVGWHLPLRHLRVRGAVLPEAAGLLPGTRAGDSFGFLRVLHQRLLFLRRRKRIHYGDFFLCKISPHVEWAPPR